jgi:DNA-binding SARP family transcriptional activator
VTLQAQAARVPVELSSPRGADESSLLRAEVVRLQREVTALHTTLGRLPVLTEVTAAPAQRDPPTARLHATFLGTFSVLAGDAALDLGRSRSVNELCRYLIAHRGQLTPRDQLLELLWPDAPSDRGLHRLHVAISLLRKVVDEPHSSDSCIHLDGDAYALIPGSVDTDCELFDTHFLRARACLGQRDSGGAAAAFLDALTLYRGDYLADEPYEEWTHQARAHFAERRMTAMMFLCERASQARELEAVVDYATQILNVDSLQERAHRHLMRAQYMMGQRGCAIRQYNACRLVLVRELGAQPSQLTQRLNAAICADDPLPDEVGV